MSLSDGTSIAFFRGMFSRMHRCSGKDDPTGGSAFANIRVWNPAVVQRRSRYTALCSLTFLVLGSVAHSYVLLGCSGLALLWLLLVNFRRVTWKLTLVGDALRALAPDSSLVLPKSVRLFESSCARCTLLVLYRRGQFSMARCEKGDLETVLAALGVSRNMFDSVQRSAAARAVEGLDEAAVPFDAVAARAIHWRHPLEARVRTDGGGMEPLVSPRQFRLASHALAALARSTRHTGRAYSDAAPVIREGVVRLSISRESPGSDEGMS